MSHGIGEIPRFAATEKDGQQRELEPGERVMELARVQARERIVSTPDDVYALPGGKTTPGSPVAEWIEMITYVVDETDGRVDRLDLPAYLAYTACRS